MKHRKKPAFITNAEIVEHKFFDWFARQNPNIRKYDFTEKLPEDELEPAFDVKCKSAHTYVIFETKVRVKEREKTNNWFKKFGPFLEKLKFERIMEAKRKILRDHNVEVIAFYINFSISGCLIYRLVDNDDYQYETWNLPENSKEGEKKKKDKRVHRLLVPEYELLFTEQNMDEQTWLHLNSVND